MKNTGIFFSMLTLIGCTTAQSTDVYQEHYVNDSESFNQLKHKQWYAGGLNCSSETANAIDVQIINSTSYILRQNKCLTFEAPFIYVLVGNTKTLVFDTGAVADSRIIPLYETIQQLIAKHAPTQVNNSMLVLHSHGHSDHIAGDKQFQSNTDITVVEPTKKAVQKLFNQHWPETTPSVDLGQRSVTLLASPGHQEEAISLYDPKNKWLLTGDSLYPGLIYIKHWQAYRDSIKRLTAFAQQHEVAAILGAHIEMSVTHGEVYPIGSTHHPKETWLPMSLPELQMLNSRLQQSKEPSVMSFGRFIVQPMNNFQKILSNVARWLSQ